MDAITDRQDRDRMLALLNEQCQYARRELARAGNDADLAWYAKMARTAQRAIEQIEAQSAGRQI